MHATINRKNAPSNTVIECFTTRVESVGSFGKCES